jgi:MFS family permease
VLGYTLTYLGFAVLACRLADVYGRKMVVLVGSCIFVAFSFGSGFAQNMNQLIAFRTLQGIGGSVMYSISIICFPELSPLQ